MALLPRVSLFNPFVDMSSMLDTLAMPSLANMESSMLSLPGFGACDFSESPTGYLITADVPGMTKEQVKVQIKEGNILSISGARERSDKFESADYTRSERSWGKFSRSFRLPPKADASKISATVTNGVLRVDVAKIPSEATAKPAIHDVPVH